MKRLKLLTVILLASILCLVSCSGTHNTSDDSKPYDSLNMSSNELEDAIESYSGEPDDTFIKFFVGSHLHRFEHGDSIEDIWKMPYGAAIPTGYTVVSDAGEITKTIVGGSEWTVGYDKLFLYALNTDKVFDEDVEVQNIYCLVEILKVPLNVTEEITPDSDDLFEGAMPFVYYVTSEGDFVLCRLENGGEAYLFPLKDFKEYAHAIYVEDGIEQRAAAHEEKYGDEVLMGGSTKYSFVNLMPTAENFDVSTYIFTERN